MTFEIPEAISYQIASSQKDMNVVWRWSLCIKRCGEGRRGIGVKKDGRTRIIAGILEELRTVETGIFYFSRLRGRGRGVWGMSGGEGRRR